MYNPVPNVPRGYLVMTLCVIQLLMRPQSVDSLIEMHTLLSTLFSSHLIIQGLRTSTRPSVQTPISDYSGCEVDAGLSSFVT